MDHRNSWFTSSKWWFVHHFPSFFCVFTRGYFPPLFHPCFAVCGSPGMRRCLMRSGMNSADGWWLKPAEDAEMGNLRIESDRANFGAKMSHGFVGKNMDGKTIKRIIFVLTLRLVLPWVILHDTTWYYTYTTWYYMIFDKLSQWSFQGAGDPRNPWATRSSLSVDFRPWILVSWQRKNGDEALLKHDRFVRFPCWNERT